MTRAKNSQSSLRKSALGARRILTADERERASRKICDRVIRSHEFMACEALVCYLPLADEVDTTRVIERAWRANKRVFAPVTSGGRGMILRRFTPDTPMTKSQFGVLEPAIGPTIAAKQCDLVITPLAAFDDKRRRIGMGGGYFDECFAFLRHRRQWLKPKLLGVAFDCQQVKKIATNPWDIQLYQVITESRRF